MGRGLRRYELVKVVGSGSYGKVAEAFDRQTEVRLSCFGSFLSTLRRWRNRRGQWWWWWWWCFWGVCCGVVCLCLGGGGGKYRLFIKNVVFV